MKLIFFILFLFFSFKIFSNDDVIFKYLDTMSSSEKAAQVLLVGVDGNTEIPLYMKKYFDGLVPGAFILFKNNIASSPLTVSKYISSLCFNAENNKYYIPPIISTDCEGGFVYRLKKIASPLPSPKKTAEKISIGDVKKLYELTAEQMNLLGINLNFAPVAEIYIKGENDFMYEDERLFSSDIETVKNYSIAFIQAMNSKSVITAVKHFPGNAAADTHYNTAILKCDLQEFYNNYILLFKKIFENTKTAVLISHVIVSCIDDQPFCFSKKGIKNILREELNFDGVVITDDIAMKGLSADSISDKAVKALSAGCDLIMCTEPCFQTLVNSLKEKIEADIEFSKRIDEAVYRILKMKMEAGILSADISANKSKKFDSVKFNNAKYEAKKIITKYFDY